MSERTILLDVFAANQKRERLIAEALAETDLPPEDYPVYVYIGVEGPLTPTELARALGMPLSTVLFRVRRLQRRGHAERIPNPEDGRSYLLRLTPSGERLLAFARPLFRARALAVEARLGDERVAALREALDELGRAIERELDDALREPAS
ncbi:MAG TPA: MarR family transcriptional regulator [Gaiellaceae bacterium]|nr:MarR family transcriptional regulator [Gaiellaceae bacterium]